MIQDIYPHVYDNAYMPCETKDSDIVFVFYNGKMIRKEPDAFFTYGDLPAGTETTYLFRIDDRVFRLTEYRAEGIETDLRDLRRFSPKHLRFAAVTAWQIHGWMKENTYCGRCGHPMEKDAKERAMRCPSCGHIVYPKIMPAVIVGVLYEDRLLVTRLAASPYRNYALIAGFHEIGETIEETVKREVKEEAGLDVTDVRYYKSQPWSFSSTLLLGFTCRVQGSPEIHPDHLEIKEARWMSRDEEYEATDDVSLTSHMIRAFRKGEL